MSDRYNALLVSLLPLASGVILGIANMWVPGLWLKGVWHSHFPTNIFRADQAIEDSRYSIDMFAVLMSPFFSWLSAASAAILAQRLDVFAYSTLVFVGVLVGYGMVAAFIITPARHKIWYWRAFVTGSNVLLAVLSVIVVMTTIHR